MSISASIVRGVLRELERYGIPPARLRAGVESELLAGGNERLPLHVAQRVIEEAMRWTGRPDLGLVFGASAPMGTFRVIAPLLESAGSVREALALFERFDALLFDGPELELIEGMPFSSIRYRSHPTTSGDLARFVADATLTVIARFGTALLGPSTQPRLARFKHAPPEYASSYRELLGCDVEFRAESNELVFESSLLDRPSANPDESLRSLLERQAEGLVASLSASSSLERRVAELLALETDLAELDVISVAARFGLGARTLQRRLGQEGVSWKGILETEQRRRACTALAESQAPIKEIAASIGFSEPSAFHRAFKRWTGTTPTEYRKNAGARAAG